MLQSITCSLRWLVIFWPSQLQPFLRSPLLAPEDVSSATTGAASCPLLWKSWYVSRTGLRLLVSNVFLIQVFHYLLSYLVTKKTFSYSLRWFTLGVGQQFLELPCITTGYLMSPAFLFECPFLELPCITTGYLRMFSSVTESNLLDKLGKGCNFFRRFVTLRGTNLVNFCSLAMFCRKIHPFLRENMVIFSRILFCSSDCFSLVIYMLAF